MGRLCCPQSARSFERCRRRCAAGRRRAFRNPRRDRPRTRPAGRIGSVFAGTPTDDRQDGAGRYRPAPTRQPDLLHLPGGLAADGRSGRLDRRTQRVVPRCRLANTPARGSGAADPPPGSKGLTFSHFRRLDRHAGRRCRCRQCGQRLSRRQDRGHRDAEMPRRTGGAHRANLSAANTDIGRRRHRRRPGAGSAGPVRGVRRHRGLPAGTGQYRRLS